MPHCRIACLVAPADSMHQTQPDTSTQYQDKVKHSGGNLLCPCQQHMHTLVVGCTWCGGMQPTWKQRPQPQQVQRVAASPLGGLPFGALRCELARSCASDGLVRRLRVREHFLWTAVGEEDCGDSALKAANASSCAFAAACSGAGSRRCRLQRGPRDLSTLRPAEACGVAKWGRGRAVGIPCFSLCWLQLRLELGSTFPTQH